MPHAHPHAAAPAAGVRRPAPGPRRRALRRGLVALLAGCAIEAFAQGRLLPVDQAAAVPDFFSFRAQLQAAVARRDLPAVLGVLHREVQLSFGGDAGVERFHALWRPAAPDSRLWEVLGSTLALGGSFAPDGSFTAPYLHSQWPQDRDGFDHVAAIGTGIRVRSAPNASAEVVGSLDFSIVERLDAPGLDAGWMRIRLAPDRTGYVDARYLRSPIDHRATFARVDGRWQLVLFLAGD